MDAPSKAMTSTLFIPCAGRGTRFAAGGYSIPKPLINIDGRPAVAQIIEQYPEHWKVVIALGHKGDEIRNGISAYFYDSPRLKMISFVETKSHEQENQGLSHTVMDAKIELEGSSFVFHASDAILRPGAWKPDITSKANQVVMAPSLFPGRFRTLQRELSVPLSWNHRDVAPPEDSVEVYVGVAHIVEHEQFWITLEKQIEISPEGGETLGIDPANCSPVRLQHGDWVDTGSGLAAKELESWNTRSENILPKNEEALWFSPTTVTKFHMDKNFILGRISRAKALYPYVPIIKHSTKNTLTYEYVRGKTLSKVIEEGSFTSRPFYDFVEEFWFGKVQSGYESNSCDFLDFYQTKTLRRISTLLSMEPALSNSLIIDGVSVPDLETQLNSVNWIELATPLWGRVHGDLHPENIVVVDSGNFVFLDWRQDIAGSLDAAGDIYYDLAKFAHGLRVDHGVIHKGLYGVVVGEDSQVSIKLEQNEMKAQVYAELQQYVVERGLSWKRVQILEALIYLNIAPLHEPRTYRLLLGYLGRRLLQQALES